ncbi:unnamed protein product, partial [Phaeothamnion confervicola]
FVAPTASASCGATGCDGVVQRYYVDTGGVWVDIDGNETALSPCTAVAGRYIRLEKAYAAYTEAAALLLTAHAQGKPVSITVVQSSGDCKVAYVLSDRP